ncbi:MAG: hypothetical protein ACREJC_04470, partial [Tepidisphaeraceae bacterium]
MLTFGLGATPLINRIGAGAAALIDRDQIAVIDESVVDPRAGTCTARAENGSFFSWKSATATVPGHWERPHVGQTWEQLCTKTSTSGPEVRDHTGTAETNPNYVPQGGVSVTQKIMKVGPFTIPVVRSGQKYTWGLDDYSQLNAEQAKLLLEQLQTKIDGGNWVLLRPTTLTSGSHEPGSSSAQVFYQSGKPTGTVIKATWPQFAPWNPPGGHEV